MSKKNHAAMKRLSYAIYMILFFFIDKTLFLFSELIWGQEREEEGGNVGNSQRESRPKLKPPKLSQDTLPACTGEQGRLRDIEKNNFP